MRSKNMLRRLNPEQLIQFTTKDTNADNLQLCLQLLQAKNQPLVTQKDRLIQEVTQIRQSIRAVVRELKDSMREKLKMKTTLVMDSASRPGVEQMGQLTAFFNVVEKQDQINVCKDKTIATLSTQASQAIKSKEAVLEEQKDYTDLDAQFTALQHQCEQQTVHLQTLLSQRDKNRAFYSNIQTQISQVRQAYASLQQTIAKAQRQMIQLSSYYEQRGREDQEELQVMRRWAQEIQGEILKGQEMINNRNRRKNGLQIQAVQFGERK